MQCLCLQIDCANAVMTNRASGRKTPLTVVLGIEVAHVLDLTAHIHLQDLFKGTYGFCGKVRSNFVGTQFVVSDSGLSQGVAKLGEQLQNFLHPPPPGRGAPVIIGTEIARKTHQ